MTAVIEPAVDLVVMRSVQEREQLGQGARSRSGTGVFLGKGLVYISVAHVVGSATQAHVRIAGLDLPANVLKKVY